MKTVMVANTIIKTTYAICVTFAAVWFNDVRILWWYLLMVFIGFTYKTSSYGERVDNV